MQVPAQFDYEVATSVEEAIELLQRHGPEARLLAGGHSLIPMMKLRLAFPEVLIDIHELDGELRFVREDDGTLVVGALARHKDLLESPVVRERYTLLADAEKFIADPLVRNMGTVGGSFAHADPSEDLPAAFVALGAEVVVRGPNGERTIAVEDLATGPFETAIEPDEILTEARVPRAPHGSSYFKVERRAGDYASAALGVALWMNEEEIEDARIGMCGVGSTTLRAREAEEVLRGQKPDEELYKRAAERAAQECDPPDDARGTPEYKRDLVRVLVVRAMEQAVSRARGGTEDRTADGR
ncbi:MAG TPA: xanthine dehydrogenase family protein subunit M [Rubrobacteraceae bacterium]|nr:xanthine dehydrogenase family protein subunit M [Rubrobacteraceae bacterium]